jgi:hypothetical protein
MTHVENLELKIQNYLIKAWPILKVFKFKTKNLKFKIRDKNVTLRNAHESILRQA